MLLPTTISSLMTGKRGLIMGVANNKSIAWGIARTITSVGAKVAFTFHGKAVEKRIRPLAYSIGSDIILECDVTNIESIENVFNILKKKWGTLDFLVHAIGYSDKNELRGRYIDTSIDNFIMSMKISVYSFTAAAQHAEKLMTQGGSILTLSYYGAQKVMPNYNMMGIAKAALEASVKYIANDIGPDGIRVNAISAGPIKTLAASGIGNFRYILQSNKENAPMRRNITINDISYSAIYLLSDLSLGVTGETHYVDCGYHTIGLNKNTNTS